MSSSPVANLCFGLIFFGAEAVLLELDFFGETLFVAAFFAVALPWIGLLHEGS